MARRTSMPPVLRTCSHEWRWPRRSRSTDGHTRPRLRLPILTTPVTMPRSCGNPKLRAALDTSDPTALVRNRPGCDATAKLVGDRAMEVGSQMMVDRDGAMTPVRQVSLPLPPMVEATSRAERARERAVAALERHPAIRAVAVRRGARATPKGKRAVASQAPSR